MTFLPVDITAETEAALPTERHSTPAGNPYASVLVSRIEIKTANGHRLTAEGLLAGMPWRVALRMSCTILSAGALEFVCVDLTFVPLQTIRKPKFPLSHNSKSVA